MRKGHSGKVWEGTGRCPPTPQARSRDRAPARSAGPVRDQLLALGCVGRPSRGGAECQPHEPPRSQSGGAEGAPAERGPSGICVRARGRHFSWRGGSGGRRLCVDLHPGSSRPSPLGQARCPPVGEAIRRAGCSMDQRPEEAAPPSPAPSPCALRLTPGPRSSDFCCLFRRGLGTEPRTERPGVSSLPLAAQGGGCPARGPATFPPGEPTLVRPHRNPLRGFCLPSGPRPRNTAT